METTTLILGWGHRLCQVFVIVLVYDWLHGDTLAGWRFRPRVLVNVLAERWGFRSPALLLATACGIMAILSLGAVVATGGARALCSFSPVGSRRHVPREGHVRRVQEGELKKPEPPTGSGFSF